MSAGKLASRIATTGGSGSFVCPQCGSGTGVVDSRTGTAGTVRRRRVCGGAEQHRFTTYELAINGVPPALGPDQVGALIEAIDILLAPVLAAVARAKEAIAAAKLLEDLKP